LMYLVGAHAFAALVHRYVFKDGVLKRMLPVAG
jgi:cytochrome b561